MVLSACCLTPKTSILTKFAQWDMACRAQELHKFKKLEGSILQKLHGSRTCSETVLELFRRGLNMHLSFLTHSIMGILTAANQKKL